MKIEVIGRAITKEEQLEIGRLLLKAGYTVAIRRGKNQDNKSVDVIDYEMRDENVKAIQRDEEDRRNGIL